MREEFNDRRAKMALNMQNKFMFDHVLKVDLAFWLNDKNNKVLCNSVNIKKNDKQKDIVEWSLRRVNNELRTISTLLE